MGPMTSDDDVGGRTHLLGRKGGGCGSTFQRWEELKAKGKGISENDNKPDVRTDRFLNARFGQGAVPQRFEDGIVTDQPCELNDYKASASDPPLYSLVETFADDQATWVTDFVLALEKMLSNGVAAHHARLV